MRTKSANRIVAVALAAVLLVPTVSFAETMPALTRDQVRAELRQLEQAGYEPAASHDARYPADLQIAEATVVGRDASVQIPAAGMSYGTSTSGSSEVGAAQKPLSVSK
ncbi:DUF4148 domain-containing protein [Paraburkholderia fungorum]|uniref:DUF4148 domain-containing protein n=1 Tax=Paraburkholderia fungorum TaxID=134537 RepID=UPI0038B93F72